VIIISMSIKLLNGCISRLNNGLTPRIGRIRFSVVFQHNSNGLQPLTGPSTYQWHVPMTKLSSLHHLLNSSTGKGNRVNLIVCVVSVDRVKVVQRKEEKVRGREGTLCIGRFEVVVPGDDRDKEIGCDVKLWEGCARDWGEEVVRRGDVVLLESMCHIPYLH
jgi:hypothetical protein